MLTLIKVSVSDQISYQRILLDPDPLTQTFRCSLIVKVKTGLKVRSHVCPSSEVNVIIQTLDRDGSETLTLDEVTAELNLVSVSDNSLSVSQSLSVCLSVSQSSDQPLNLQSD